MTWGLWVAEYWPCESGKSGLQEFWLRDGAGAELTYKTAEEAESACREWFGQIPEHMTVKEYPR